MQLVWKTINLSSHNINSLRHDPRIKGYTHQLHKHEIIISINIDSNSFKVMITTHKDVQELNTAIISRPYQASQFHILLNLLIGNMSTYQLSKL